MTFLRNEPRRRVLQATLSVESAYDRSDQEILLISPDIAEDVGVALKSTEDDVSYLATRSAPGHLPSFGWTIFREEVDETLPIAYCKILANNAVLFGSRYIEITSVSPPTLESVMLTCPKAIYESSKYDPNIKRHFLDVLYNKGQLVRRGDFYNEICCRVSLCEPSDQGLVDRTTTKILLVSDPFAENSGGETGQTGNALSDDLDLEISEYLKLDLSLNLSSSVNNSVVQQVSIRCLEKPMNPESLMPLPGIKTDLEACVFAKVELLGRIGCFSGDIVCIESESAWTSRYVRLFSFPEPNSIPTDEIRVSPFLAYNLNQNQKSPFDKVSLRKMSAAESIPICSEVTISRVSASLTTERVYQTAFLSGLRRYFETANRVVKLHDLIFIPVDTILAETLQNIDSKESPGVFPQGKPNNVALFQISSVLGNNGQPLLSSCIIDSKLTKLIQSGLVKVPCIPTTFPWRQYLDLPTIFQYKGSEKDFTYARKLEKLLETSVTSVGRHLNATVLLKSSKRGAGKSTLMTSTCLKLGLHLYEIDCYQIVGEGDTKTVGMLKARLERALSISPCVVLLKHIEAVSSKSDEDGSDSGLVSNVAELLQDYIDEKAFILAATVGDVDKMSESVRGKFKLEIDIGVPTESERLAIFDFFQHQQPLAGRDLLQKLDRKNGLFTGFKFREDVQLKNLALQSAGLIPPDLESIVKGAKRKAEKRISKLASSKEKELDLIIACEGSISISPQDFDDAIQEARSKYSDSIGAPKIPNVNWKDVGGLEGVKQDILDTIEMPLKHPHLFSSGVKKRSGILFYGPPGTGKTLLAKAIATNFSLNFFSVKGPELLNMYIGESEANVRKVFQKARDAKPCVVFFDELDSVAPKRGNQGDSGGVMDRIVSQLLAELDGMSGSDGEGVFVVGATNRPDLLDEALLRPGRFDRMLYLGISDNHENQKNILKALTRKFRLDDSTDLQKVAESCTFNYTGADFYALCSDSYLNAMMRTAAAVDEKIKLHNDHLAEQGQDAISTRWWFQNMAGPEDVNVTVKQEDFMSALKNLTPSVSVDELNHYLKIKEGFEGAVTSSRKSEVEEVISATNSIPPVPESSIGDELAADDLLREEAAKLKSKSKSKGKGKQKAL